MVQAAHDCMCVYYCHTLSTWIVHQIILPTLCVVGAKGYCNCVNTSVISI